MKNHHAYLGGLLEHVVNLMELVTRVAPLLSGASIADLLLMGAFLHDMGKIDELTYERDFAYTDEGQLIGHVVMAVGMLEAEARARPSGSPASRCPHETGAAAQAHDRQPSRPVRVRQPEAADDARSRRPAPPRQSRRQDPQLRAADARRPERRERLDQLPSSRWAASCSRATPGTSHARRIDANEASSHCELQCTDVAARCVRARAPSDVDRR